MYDASYDGGVQTNLRRFVYLIMVLLMFAKVRIKEDKMIVAHCSDCTEIFGRVKGCSWNG